MRKNRKTRGMILAAVLAGAMGLSACSQDGGGTQTTAAAVEAETAETSLAEERTEKDLAETEEASLAEEKTAAGDEDAEGTEEVKDQAIMVVSFGTSYNESRDLTIGAIEGAIEEAFPDFSVYRAFTSQIIIDKLKERDGLEIDNIEEALAHAKADGVKRLVVQPTHLMDGFEYMDVAAALEECRDKFDEIVLAKPLLADEEDYQAVVKAIMEVTASYDDGETAICFMGHGTEADANAVYPKLQEELAKANEEHCPYFIGTVEAEPDLDAVMAAMKESGPYRRVVLEPLMVVAGDHANNDMAGEEEDSWKSILEANGYEVECVLKGLGEFPAIQDIYVAHTQAAVDSLK